MRSPFPGMDPYLEDPDVWPDFHGTFLVALRAQLNEQLPPRYVARWDRHVWIDEPDAEQPYVLGRPDVFVTDPTPGTPGGAGVAPTLTAPAIGTVPAVDPKGKPFIKIIDARGRRVVTVIELLSPANKSAGKDRDAYLAKRQEYFRAGTNLVEIDLLRGGERPPVVGVAPADYYVLVSRAWEYPRVGVWPLSVRDPLPPVPVPLDPEVAPVRLELRPALDRAFAEARLGEELAYDQPVVPALNESDTAWARARIAERAI